MVHLFVGVFDLLLVLALIEIYVFLGRLKI